MWDALPGVGTCHNTAKLFPRPDAAIEFHVGLQLPRMVWDTTTGASYDGHNAHPVLFGFADSRIDTQISFNIGHFRNLNTMSSSSLWQRFHFLDYRDLGFSL